MKRKREQILHILIFTLLFILSCYDTGRFWLIEQQSFGDEANYPFETPDPINIPDPTLGPTANPAPDPTPTPSPSPTPSPTPNPIAGLRLFYATDNTATGVIESSINVEIENNSGSDLSFIDLSLHYYFTLESPASLYLNVLQSPTGMLPQDVHASFVHRYDNAYYLEVSFGADITIPNSTTSEELKLVLYFQGAQTVDKSDDPSFDPAKTTYAEHPAIPLFINGSQATGTIPAPPTPEPTLPPGVTPSPSPVPDIRVQYKTYNIAPSDPEAPFDLRIVNNNNYSFPMRDLELRYYLVKDDPAVTLSYTCLSAPGNLQAGDVSVTFETQDAVHYYAKITFTAQETLPPFGISGDLRLILYLQNGPVDESNDPSYDPAKSNFTEHTTIAVFRNGEYLSGTEAF